MGKTDSGASDIVKGIRFVGHTTGSVKTLRGFRKGRHRAPDSVNPSTQAFLARLCADELAVEGESFFQKARSACDYRRKDLSLTLASPLAQLTAKDFTLEIHYAFDGEDPEAYRLQWTLNGFTELAFLRGDACEQLFSDRFQELVFTLTKGARVEAVIDAVESLEESLLKIDYPSDYAHCLLSVDGVDAQVRFDGAELAMIFQKSGSPSELLDGFLLVRKAFILSKSKILSGLLG